MKVPIFLSRPTPHLDAQKVFIAQFTEALTQRGFEPISMGPGSSYDYDAPLVGIRRLLMHCCGLVSVAFRRSRASIVTKYPGADLPNMTAREASDVWFTSPYCQIEPAMAFQLGLPILIMRERGVLAEGVLERGVTGLYLPEFSLADGASFINGAECRSLLDQWGGYVRATYKRRGDPPMLYD